MPTFESEPYLNSCISVDSCHHCGPPVKTHTQYRHIPQLLSPQSCAAASLPSCARAASAASHQSAFVLALTPAAAVPHHISIDVSGQRVRCRLMRLPLLPHRSYDLSLLLLLLTKTQ